MSRSASLSVSVWDGPPARNSTPTFTGIREITSTSIVVIVYAA